MTGTLNKPIAREWTPQRREVLEGLYCVRGWPIRDIAEALGVTPEAVRGQTHILGLLRPPGWSRTWKAT
jgi:predicted ArsR family transcriptional regulator